jgi:hypothetical protein
VRLPLHALPSHCPPSPHTPPTLSALRPLCDNAPLKRPHACSFPHTRVSPPKTLHLGLDEPSWASVPSLAQGAGGPEPRADKSARGRPGFSEHYSTLGASAGLGSGAFRSEDFLATHWSAWTGNGLEGGVDSCAAQPSTISAHSGAAKDPLAEEIAAARAAAHAKIRGRGLGVQTGVRGAGFGGGVDCARRLDLSRIARFSKAVVRCPGFVTNQYASPALLPLISPTAFAYWSESAVGRRPHTGSQIVESEPLPKIFCV